MVQILDFLFLLPMHKEHQYQQKDTWKENLDNQIVEIFLNVEQHQHIRAIVKKIEMQPAMNHQVAEGYAQTLDFLVHLVDAMMHLKTGVFVGYMGHHLLVKLVVEDLIIVA